MKQTKRISCSASIRVCTLLVAVALITATGCKKLFVTDPPNRLVLTDVQGKNGPTLVLNGIYRYLRSVNSTNQFGMPSICLGMDLLGPDMGMVREGWFTFYYDYSIPTLQTSNNAAYTWHFFYQVIQNANIVINASGVAPAEKAQAHALRAYAYFWLVNIFSSKKYKDAKPDRLLPMYTKFVTQAAPPETVEKVYASMIADLDTAMALFRRVKFQRANKSYIDSSVVRGLQARTYLFMEEWAKAKTAALAAIGKTSESNLDGSDLMDTLQFKAGFNDINNPEWMWGLPTNDAQKGVYASFASHIDPLVNGYADLYAPAFMSVTLYDSMNNKDVRKWLVTPRKSAKMQLNKDTNDLACLKFRDPNSSISAVEKFKQDRKKAVVKPNWLGAFPLMRKAEMYLIIAEACCNTSGGSTCCTTNANNCCLAKLREKRGVASNGANCTKDTVYQERRRELWGEGFSWFDLKRLGKPLVRDSSHSQPDPRAVNKGVLMIRANSDSMRFLIPQAELNQNAHFRGIASNR